MLFVCIYYLKLFTRRRIEFLSDRSEIESVDVIHVRHKEISINRCAIKISQRNTGQPVENCDQFARISLNSQSRSHY